jgi:hypothetical protein
LRLSKLHRECFQQQFKQRVTTIALKVKPTTSHNRHANATIEQIHKAVRDMLILLDLEYYIFELFGYFLQPIGWGATITQRFMSPTVKLCFA